MRAIVHLLKENAERSMLAGGLMHRSKRAGSLDHLVGGHLHDQRHCQAERLRRLEIDGQLEFHRLLDRQVGRLFPFENPPDVTAGEAIGIADARSITDQPADVGKLAQEIDCRQRMTRRRPTT
jgi:hypothetical protein